MRLNEFFKADLSEDSETKKIFPTVGVQVHPYDANLVSSKNVATDKHSLLLDLDTEHFYVESSTKNHGHLYIKADLELAAMLEIMDVLTKHGLIQAGYNEAAKQRGSAMLRLPGVSKHVQPTTLALIHGAAKNGIVNFNLDGAIAHWPEHLYISTEHSSYN